MSKKIIQIRSHLNAMNITWVLNNICTNHCDYCPPVLHRGNNHNFKWENAKSFIERIFDRYLRVNCSISGGEPTLSPFLPELVKMFNDRGHPIGITTNGARTVRYYEELAPMLSFISFSYHPSYEDPSIIEKAIACSPYSSVSIRIMMDSRYWDHCVEVYERCAAMDHLFSVESVKILPEISDRHVGDDYTEEQLQWLKNNSRVYRKTDDYKSNPKWKFYNSVSSFWYNDGSIQTDDPNSIISRGENDFRGWACNIGIESMCIHYNGWVGKATCKVDQNLFHIDNHMNHSLPESAVICTQRACMCGTDVRISKVPVMNPNDPWVIQNSVDVPPKNEEEYNQKYYDEQGRVIIPIRPA